MSFIALAEDQGQTIKVRVTFSDDAGNETTLTSVATDEVEAAPQPDSPATGQPTISGMVQVGKTLTVDTLGIADADGLVNATYRYQWVAGESDIGGATGSSYTLGADDEGKTIKVRVTVTDDAGNETTLTSGATDTVEAPQPPAKPTGLSAAAVSHDAVTLAWGQPAGRLHHRLHHPAPRPGDPPGGDLPSPSQTTPARADTTYTDRYGRAG